MRTGHMPAWAACLASLALSVLASAPVKVSLQTPERWPEAPFLTQILETLHLEDADAFFPLLAQLSTLRGTDQEVYTQALGQIQNWSGWSQSVGHLDIFQLSLASKEASPRIQAAYEWYKSLDVSVSEGCQSWVTFDDVTGACSVEELTRLRTGANAARLNSLPFDHLRSPATAPTAVLYADVLSDDFTPLLQHLQQVFHSDPSFNFILRWRPSLSHPSSPLQLNSYGASLYIKKSDYLAIDDRNQQGNTLESSRLEDGEMSLQQIWADPANAPSTLKPLTRQALSELGDKATHFILAQPDPLDALVKLSQDFPKYATFLSEVLVDTEGPVYKEVQQNRLSQQQPGINAVWMNGLQLNPKQLDTYALLGLLRSERSRVDDLTRLGLNVKQAVKLLSHPAMSEASSDKASSLPDLMKLLRSPEVSLADIGTLFDASDRQEDGEAILWFNDLEQDRRYARWPRSLQALLQPSFTGAPQQIRRNLFNIVFALDMSRTWSHTYIAEFVQPFIGRMMPFRIGLVPLVDASSTSSLEMGRLSRYIFENLSPQDAMTFSSMLSRSAQGPQTDLAAARAIFERLSSKRPARQSSLPLLLSFDDVVADGDLSPSRAYAERLDLSPEKGHVFIDGMYIQTEGSWQKFVQATLSLHSRYLQAQVAKGAIKDQDDASHFFYDLPSTFDRRSELVFSSNDHPLKVERSFRPQCDGIWLEEASKDIQPLSLYAADTDGTLQEPLKQLQAAHKDLRICYTQMRSSSSAINASTSQPCSININGRILDLPSCDTVNVGILDLLVNVERKQRAAPTLQALDDVLGNRVLPADLVAGVTAVLADTQAKDKTQKAFGDAKLDRGDPLTKLKNSHTTVTSGQPHPSWAVFKAILDPTSEGAQRSSAVLKSLAAIPGVSIEIVLVPKPHARELTVKRFYREVRQSHLLFEPDGSVARATIEFAGPPEAVLLNLELDTHPSWLAFSKETKHDLENIKLSDLPAEERATGIHATFELEKLLIEGHCRELPNGVPPRGLQLELLDRRGDKSDSLVMANMAYIQLHADSPGLYDLGIRPGRSSEVYSLTSLGLTGMDSEPVNVTGTKVAVTSFDGATIYPQFERNAGMEYADVLDTSQPPRSPSFLSVLGNFFGGARTNALSAPTKTQADINVFTVASGHLYERMAMIMMVSVMRHTESSVKFWFITNFLSPAFKSFLPHLATQYGFQYELVTYQWPHWLRSQTEKQRTIWGYKVLFLDVLFPLGLDRVIFVDSDQIVRADLKELVDLDLLGAPYAYAPMGDDREEMEGFRFWKTGYWRDALRGRPYHISALYVVDLERFRQLAAGDRLRGQYQALSADPNSLANLDQDLPNNMQNMLPIYTLDRSWLWCETWCSDESLASAKTIDLCNNPLTHEPKLARARRLIPEWTVYDREIAEVAATVAKQNEGGVGAAFEADASSLEQARLQEEEKAQHKAEGQVRDEL